MTATIFGIILVALAVGLVLYAVAIYNGLVQLKHEIDRAWANIDVLLKQRFDEIPKLIAAVEGYMQYERETLTKIIEARNRYLAAGSVHDKLETSNALSGALKGLFALAENYPDLKANQNFVHLQQRVSGLEESLADRREFYNAAVNSFNIRIEQIPDVFVARALNYQRRELFKVPELEKRDVPISFKMPK
ncbi:MAG: LemA family protein [Oligoflexia bacterium]|nr:LemA family protein [Oligoflexia bacterium]